MAAQSNCSRTRSTICGPASNATRKFDLVHCDLLLVQSMARAKMRPRGPPLLPRNSEPSTRAASAAIRWPWCTGVARHFDPVTHKAARDSSDVVV